MSKYKIFAYGSNLSKTDWSSFSARHGVDPACLKPAGKAFLPDHHLSFDRYSVSRRGGVLNVRKRKGDFVEGALFETDDEGMRLLRIKEGVAAGAYQEQNVTVIDRDGLEVPAITFVVPEENITDFVAPAKSYLDVCREGFERFELHTAPLCAAAKNLRLEPQIGFFSYGTFMRGQPRFFQVSPFGIRCAIMATIAGDIFDAGSFPALDLAGQSFVAGDIFVLDSLGEFLAVADRIEGFRGFGTNGSLFRRTITEVDVGGAGPRLVWVYVQDGPRHTPIECCDWRVHTGVDLRFREETLRQHTSGEGGREISERYAKDFLGDTFRLPEQRIVDERSLAQRSGNWAANSA